MLEAPLQPKEVQPCLLPVSVGNGGRAKKTEKIDRVERLSRGQTALTLFLDSKMESLLAQMKAREHHENKINRWHLVLETTIVGLIVVEVMLFCYDLFFKV